MPIQCLACHRSHDRGRRRPAPGPLALPLSSSLLERWRALWQLCHNPTKQKKLRSLLRGSFHRASPGCLNERPNIKSKKRPNRPGLQPFFFAGGQAVLISPRISCGTCRKGRGSSALHVVGLHPSYWIQKGPTRSQKIMATIASPLFEERRLRFLGRKCERGKRELSNIVLGVDSPFFSKGFGWFRKIRMPGKNGRYPYTAFPQVSHRDRLPQHTPLRLGPLAQMGSHIIGFAKSCTHIRDVSIIDRCNHSRLDRCSALQKLPASQNLELQNGQQKV